MQHRVYRVQHHWRAHSDPSDNERIYCDASCCRQGDHVHGDSQHAALGCNRTLQNGDKGDTKETLRVTLSSPLRAALNATCNIINVFSMAPGKLFASHEEITHRHLGEPHDKLLHVWCQGRNNFEWERLRKTCS